MPLKSDLGHLDDEDFSLLKAIDYHLEKKVESFKERDYFYMSEVGKPLIEVYKGFKNQKPKSFNAKTKRILENGNYVHSRIQKLFAEMRILIAAEIECNTPLIHGRCDAIITDGQKNYIVDIKSCSQWTYNKLFDSKPEDALQVMMYMYFFNLEDGILLYECKDNQDIKCFKVKLDRVRIEKILEQLKKIKECVDKNTDYISEQELIDLKGGESI